MSKIPKDIEREQARLVQMEAAQMMLFSMEVMGENIAGYQLEIDGVVQSLIVRRVSQVEFQTIMKEAVTAAHAERARRDGP